MYNKSCLIKNESFKSKFKHNNTKTDIEIDKEIDEVGKKILKRENTAEKYFL